MSRVKQVRADLAEIRETGQPTYSQEVEAHYTELYAMITYIAERYFPDPSQITFTNTCENKVRGYFDEYLSKCLAALDIVPSHILARAEYLLQSIAGYSSLKKVLKAGMQTAQDIFIIFNSQIRLYLAKEGIEIPAEDVLQNSISEALKVAFRSSIYTLDSISAAFLDASLTHDPSVYFRLVNGPQGTKIVFDFDRFVADIKEVDPVRFEGIKREQPFVRGCPFAYANTNPIHGIFKRTNDALRETANPAIDTFSESGYNTV